MGLSQSSAVSCPSNSGELSRWAERLHSGVFRNYGDIFARFPNSVIPAKAGIQVVGLPHNGNGGLDARLRGHDGWNVRPVSIKYVTLITNSSTLFVHHPVS